MGPRGLPLVEQPRGAGVRGQLAKEPLWRELAAEEPLAWEAPHRTVVRGRGAADCSAWSILLRGALVVPATLCAKLRIDLFLGSILWICGWVHYQYRFQHPLPQLHTGVFKIKASLI